MRALLVMLGRFRSEMGVLEKGPYYAGGSIYGAREGVDCDYVGGFVVPGAVFTPVGGGDFFPGIVEGAIGGKDFHCSGRVGFSEWCIGARSRF